MTRLALAPLAVLVAASLGSTGCSYEYRYHRVRYARPYVHAAYYYGAQPPPPAAPPPEAEEPAPAPVAPAAPPAPPAPPPMPAAQAPGTIIVHAHVPGTTVIVLNPPKDRPAVGIQQAAPAVPPQAAPPPPPVRREAPQQPPQGWFEEE